jgi:hypothetical protein
MKMQINFLWRKQPTPGPAGGGEIEKNPVVAIDSFRKTYTLLRVSLQDEYPISNTQ